MVLFSCLEAFAGAICLCKQGSIVAESGTLTHQKIGSCLEQAVWVEYPFIMSSEVGTHSFSRCKAHLQGYFCPVPLTTDYVKTSLTLHMLWKDRKKKYQQLSNTRSQRL